MRRLLPTDRVVAGPLRGRRLPAAGLAQRLGIYELPAQVALTRQLRPDAIVYDVGAHLGYFALLSALTAGPRGQVYAFEPLPANAARIRHLAVATGSAAPIELIEAAVAEREGSARLTLGTDAATTVAALSEHPETDAQQLDAQQLTVRLTTLDTFAALYRPPTLVKVDVEGAECRVLEGATELLQNVRPTWIFEVHSAQLERDVRDILQSHRYHWHPLERYSSRQQEYPRHGLATSLPH